MRGTWLFLAGVVAAAGGVVLARAEYLSPGPLPVASAIVVARGGLRDVGRRLAQAGVIRSGVVFEIVATATSFEGKLRAAEFAFPAHASVAEVLRVLRFGDPVLHKLTLAEGVTSAEVARVLASADWLSGPVRVPAEGSVLPQTYAFERGTSRDRVLARAERAMRKAVEEAWAGRMPGLPLRDARAAVIVASLVERETGVPAERPMVARVFYNRLQSGMKLQSDPSTAYGASGGSGELGRSLDRADLRRPDAYNTYVLPGLPAAPICNPGRATLDAVLHPAPTAALYFVADGKGGHVFADTLAAHVRNVGRLRSAQKQ